MTEKEVNLKLIIPLASYRKIMAYAQICDTEISGFADLEYNQERSALIVGNVYLLEQRAGGADVHMDEEEVSKFNIQRIKAGAEQLPQLWWHSHVNMEAFFSGTDEATLKQLQNDTFIVALVVNKRKEMKAKAYIATESVTKIMGQIVEEKKFIEVDPLQVSIELEYERIPEALKKEVEKKVKARVYETPKLPYKSPYVWDLEDGPYGEKNRRFFQHGQSTNPKGYKSLVGVLYLPKDPEKALERIEKLGLLREYDNEKHEWVYKNPKTGGVWVDYWDTLEKFEEENKNNKGKKGN